MTTFYFVRHAESEMNLKSDYICGRSETIDLSGQGRRQAKKLGAWIGLNIDRLDLVASSPATRSLQTIELALEDTPFRDHEVEVDDRLHEMTQGLFEGQLRTEVYTPEIKADIEIRGLDFALEGGESMNDVTERMYDWVNEKRKEFGDGAQILAGTHGVAIKCLAGYLRGANREEILDTQINNASVNILRFDRDSRPHMDQLNVST